MELLEAGSRDEEIRAEEARLARLQEELKYFCEVASQRTVCRGHAGVIVTPHVKEKAGQYLNEGDLICVVEEVAGLEIEIQLPEQELRDVEGGQRVELKLAGGASLRHVRRDRRSHCTECPDGRHGEQRGRCALILKIRPACCGLG